MTTTNDTPPDSQPLILKTDTRGRVLMPAERREALLDEFERSGLSGKKFAALAGIKYQTFATWAQRRRRQRALPTFAAQSKPKQEPVSWLEAVVQPAPPTEPLSRTGLWLHLPGGVRAEITHAHHVTWAAALVRALEQPC